MLNHPTSVLKAGFESYTVLKMHKDLKENSLLPSLFHFHSSIPHLSWLSHVSAFHWPSGSRVWKNKLRRKGQEQRTTSSSREERCADALTAAWPFALIMDVWCRRFFFQAETEQVSLTLECGGTVSNLCQVNQEERRKPYAVAAPHFTSTSTYHTHKTCFLCDLPSSHCQTLMRIVVSAIISDGWGQSTHPLDMLSDCEPMEEFSALLSQSFTSRQRIYIGGEKNTSTSISAFAITEFSNLCCILQKHTCELL